MSEFWSPGGKFPFRTAGLVLALFSVSICFGHSEAQAQRAGARGNNSPAVTLAQVKIERMNERIAAVGSGRARQQVTLTTRTAGVITEVLFEGGQLVEANQALVKLNAETEAIAVETAEAQRAQAADTVARYKQLNPGTYEAWHFRGRYGTQGRRRRPAAGSR